MAGVFFPVDVEFIGAASLKKKMDKLAKSDTTDKEMFQALLKGGLLIHADAVRSIVSRSPGSTSAVRYDPKRDVKVSPGGTPPNADTGYLHKSVRVAFNENEMWVDVGTDVDYGAFLEFGAASINLEARPWLGPAFAKNRDKIIKMLRKVTADAVKRDVT